MCSPWDTGCMANEVATAVSNTMFGQISMLITTAEQDGIIRELLAGE